MPDGTNGRIIENGHVFKARNGQYGYGRDYLLGQAPLAPVIERVHQRLRQIPTGGIILDLGCGVGRFADGANGSRNYPIVGIDLNPQAVNEYKSKIQEHGWPDEAHVGDITDLRIVGGRRISAAVSWRVLHALPTELQPLALQEANRVLPGGASLFVAVASKLDWKAQELRNRGELKAIGQNNCQEVMALEQPFHVEFFDDLKLRRLALTSGFRVLETEIFAEPSGYKHLQENKPENTYLFGHLVKA